MDKLQRLAVVWWVKRILFDACSIERKTKSLYILQPQKNK
jgi:hypothetical protein